MFLFKRKHYEKPQGYQMETRDGVSEYVWDCDEVEIKPFRDGEEKKKREREVKQAILWINDIN